MHRYRVTDIGADDARITLRDSAGKCHIALAMNDVPGVGTDLQGSLPGLGFRVLLCPLSNRIFRSEGSCQRPEGNGQEVTQVGWARGGPWGDRKSNRPPLDPRPGQDLPGEP